MKEVLKRSFIFIIVIFLGGCIRARDYVDAKSGVVTLRVNVPLGSGKSRKDYLLLNKGSFYIDRGDTKKIVRSRLGPPSSRGTTLEGYELWRYDKWGLEIYFDKNYVCGWRKVEFKP